MRIQGKRNNEKYYETDNTLCLIESCCFAAGSEGGRSAAGRM